MRRIQPAAKGTAVLHRDSARGRSGRCAAAAGSLRQPGKAGSSKPERPDRDRRAEAGAGITLIELVVAMGVTAFGLLGLLAFLLLMGRSVAEQDRATAALFCAQEKLEQLKFLAVQGAFSQEGEESLTEGAYAGLARRWSVSPEALGSGGLHIEAECSCRLWGRDIRRALETLVCAGQ